MATSLIIGCGDTGVRVAARAVAAGEEVVGVVRSAASAARVRAVGARALTLDLDGDLSALPACDRLFYFAPPPREGETDTRMATALAALPSLPEYVVYISTSGVYGDCGGAWATETQPLRPGTARARRRVDAERQIRALRGDAIVLRAPGIYGPDRLPVDRRRAGEPILDDAAGGWSNRVHIDDLAEYAWQAGGTRWAHGVYNACDGQPTRLGIFYDTLADMLGLERPARIGWDEAETRFSAMRLSFLRESRRLSNARLVADSGIAPHFTDFRDGLAASLRAQSAG